MKKLYSLVAIAASIAAIAQTATITLKPESFSSLGVNNYGNGIEKTATIGTVNFGGKAITGNVSNTPAGASAGQYIQAQASNGLIYNTSALPGKLISITINQGGTARTSTLSGGNSLLVNSTTGDYNVTGGTAVGAASATGWTSADLAGTNYTFFAIKRAANAAYISSIVIEYDTSSLAVIDADSKKINFIKNTVVEQSIIFGTDADVKIYSANGQLVRSAAVKSGQSVDVSSLAKGIYIVAGEFDGQKVTKKIIKK